MRSNRILHLVPNKEERSCKVCGKHQRFFNTEKESVAYNERVYREFVVEGKAKSFNHVEYTACSGPVTRMFNDVVNLEGFKL